MKKILITGAKSYIGESFTAYLKEKYPENYLIETVDMIDGSWKEKDFSGYHAVFHVAGIAHVKETDENRHLYYEVNRDLPVEVAKKAKESGVGLFVFLSSMSVYGLETGTVTGDTPLLPNSAYGKSKSEAEELLREIGSETFKVAIVRPPMVYGNGCKGNFQSVVKLVKKLPVFPRVKNRRSMIYIDNLSEFVRILIDKDLSGTYCPQNREYTDTTNMAKILADKLGKKIYCSYLLGFAVKLMSPFLSIAKKGFGSLIYEGLEEFDFEYCVVSAEEGIRRSI